MDNAALLPTRHVSITYPSRIRHASIRIRYGYVVDVFWEGGSGGANLNRFRVEGLGFRDFV